MQRPVQRTGRNELGERKNKVADVAKPGAGRAEGDAVRERGPEHTGPTITGPTGQQHCLWVLAGHAGSAC